MALQSTSVTCSRTCTASQQLYIGMNVGQQRQPWSQQTISGQILPFCTSSWCVLDTTGRMRSAYAFSWSVPERRRTCSITRQASAADAMNPQANASSAILNDWNGVAVARCAPLFRMLCRSAGGPRPTCTFAAEGSWLPVHRPWLSQSTAGPISSPGRVRWVLLERAANDIRSGFDQQYQLRECPSRPAPRCK